MQRTMTPYELIEHYRRRNVRRPRQPQEETPKPQPEVIVPPYCSDCPMINGEHSPRCPFNPKPLTIADQD